MTTTATSPMLEPMRVIVDSRLDRILSDHLDALDLLGCEIIHEAPEDVAQFNRTEQCVLSHASPIGRKRRFVSGHADLLRRRSWR